MMLSELTGEDHILLLKGRYKKEELLYILTKKLCELEDIKDSDAVYSQLIEREKLGSTGIGNEIAIPHTRIAFIEKPCVLITLLQDGVNYDSADQRPVKIIFLLLTPEKALDIHLHLLSHISRIVGEYDFKSKVLNANTKDEVFHILEGVEKGDK